MRNTGDLHLIRNAKVVREKGGGGEDSLSIIVLGASGDLSKKKTFPSLWNLYMEGLLPTNTKIFGLARANYTHDEFRAFMSQNIIVNQSMASKLEQFKSLCYYSVTSVYSSEKLSAFYGNYLSHNPTNQLFYLALPPNLFVNVSSAIKQGALSPDGWNRIIIEKPFGSDLESYQKLDNDLAEIFAENQMYRIDHYLGKEMVQNLMRLRFDNLFFSNIWNKDFIKAVYITMDETFGTEGRGGYFDSYGIIRDILQNHLTQILSIIAMETPASLSPEDVRNAKVEVLKFVPEVEIKNVVLGQYVADADNKNPGYLDDPGVPKDSKTPTFARAVLYVQNERWQGVPFILRAAKAVSSKKVEIRVQFENQQNNLFGDSAQNELVITVQPKESITLTLSSKHPGYSTSSVQLPLSVSYANQFPGVYIPDAYDRLILDAIRGDHSLFVRSDELHVSWKIWSPVLHLIDSKSPDIEIHSYPFGSDGPQINQS
uniref:Glucose-6-phosphate 1-dehydrogenase n=1 Tax=Arcella intermedia TaxID=1963864 RepID=A0A6B2L2K9_9EUKA